MSELSRGYQSHYERMNSSRVSGATRYHGAREGGHSAMTNNTSDLTEVQEMSATFQPHKRHMPNSFSELSNSTNVVFPAGASAGISKDNGGKSRYQRLLGTLRNSSENKPSPPVVTDVNKQVGPNISHFDPLDQTSGSATTLPGTHHKVKPPTKGVLSARVVNGPEWKNIMTSQKKKTTILRSRSHSPLKKSVTVHSNQKRNERAPHNNINSTTFSSCLQANAAGNNALDPSGKLQLVGCYITDLDTIPNALASRVRILFLSNNSLSSTLGIQQFSNLTTLSLANNSIRYMHALVPLAHLPKLKRLSLEGNVVTGMPFYREIVLGICSSSPSPNRNIPTSSSSRGLQVLDGVKVSSQEHSDVRVQFRKVCGQFDLLRCNELRVCVLEHVRCLTACHSQLVTEVLGKFRHMLGVHIDTNDDASSQIYIGRILQVSLAGGVFRWLQIGCGTSFEQRVQDLALRMFYTATRQMTPVARQNLVSTPTQLYSFWDQLISECLQHQQQVCSELAYDCESAREKVASAFSLRRSNEMNISGEKMSLHGSHAEKENHEPLMGSVEGYGIEAWSILQQLQFDDAGGLFGGINPRAVTTSREFNSSDALTRHAWEVQVTYCGIGPHYSYPVADLLDANNVKEHQQFLREKRNLALTHQQEDHDRAVARDEAQHKKNNVESGGEVQSKYMQLLKQNLKKKKKQDVTGNTTGPSNDVKLPAVSPRKRSTSPPVSGFNLDAPPPPKQQDFCDISVLTEDVAPSAEEGMIEEAEDEGFDLGWTQYVEDEDESSGVVIEESSTSSSSGDTGVTGSKAGTSVIFDDESKMSLSAYNSYTRAKTATPRSTTSRRSPSIDGDSGYDNDIGRGRASSKAVSSLGESHDDDSSELESSESSSETSSTVSSTDSSMGSVRSEKSSKTAISAKSIKSMGSARSGKSAKSVKSVISMKSKNEDGEVKILKLTPENLKAQHSEMLKLSQENLKRPSRLGLFKELSDTVQGTANLQAGGSQNGYSIQDFMDEQRSYARHTESELGSDQGSIFSTDEMYTSPAVFLSKDHLEQERLLIKLLESKKVQDFLAAPHLFKSLEEAKTLPSWCRKMWRLPKGLKIKGISKGNDDDESVATMGTVATTALDADTLSREEVMGFLLGGKGLGPAPVPWAAANTSGAPMKTLTRLFEGASADYDTIQSNIKQVIQVRQVLQKQLTKIRDSMKNDGLTCSHEMEALAVRASKGRKANRKATDRWLVAVEALDDLFEIRQNISNSLVQDLEFEENALKVVSDDTNNIVIRKNGLIESEEEVKQAMSAMKEDMETNDSIKGAVEEFELNRRAMLYFLNPRNLRCSRQIAFINFRRRVRRQVKIREFYHEMKEVRCLERQYTSFAKLKRFVLKQKREKLSVSWMMKRRREKVWAAWRTEYRLNVSTKDLIKKQHVWLLRPSWQIWRGAKFRVISVARAKESLDLHIQMFKRKWIFLKWKDLAKRNRIKGSITDYTLDSKTLMKRSRIFHKRKLFIAWKKVYLQRQSQLLDREMVVLSLRYHSLADTVLSRWCMAYTGCHHWRKLSSTRVVNVLRRIACQRKAYKENFFVANEFWHWRNLKVALLKLEGHCRRQYSLRSRHDAVRRKYNWKLLVGSYSRWHVAIGEEAHARLQKFKAMTFYMGNMMRRAWKSLVLYYWQSLAEKQKRKLIQLQNLRYRSDKSLSEMQRLTSTPEQKRVTRLEHNDDKLKNIGEDIKHEVLMAIDVISSDEDDDDSLTSRDTNFFANETSLNWNAEISRISRRSDTSMLPYVDAVREEGGDDVVVRNCTRVKMKRLKDGINEYHSPAPLHSKISHKRPPPPVNPAVQRLKCRQYWQRWFLESQRNSRVRHACQRTKAKCELGYLRRGFNFLFYKWTKGCCKRMVAAHALAGTDSQFVETIRDYNEEIRNRKSELDLAKEELDDKQAQLAAAHCEADTQSGELSRLMSQRDQLQNANTLVNAEYSEMQEQIRAVLAYCGQSTPISNPITVDRLDEEESTINPLPTNESGVSNLNDSTLADIRARIQSYAQAKHDIEQQIEEQHRATHGVHQQYADKKRQLDQSQREVDKVCAQYKALLNELQSQAEAYVQQRHEAEHVLRECSFALEMAVDNLNMKQKQYLLQLEDLDSQYQSLKWAQQYAEETEAKLRADLESLREQGDGEDRQRMEIAPIGNMKNTELAACDYRVTAETELELTEQKLNQQQRDSVAALSNVVTGEVRLNAGDEGAFMASQCLSQEQKESLNQGSLTRLHELRGEIQEAAGKSSSRVGEFYNESALRYPRLTSTKTITESMAAAQTYLQSDSSTASSDNSTDTSVVASNTNITERIGMLSSRIKSRLLDGNSTL